MKQLNLLFFFLLTLAITAEGQRRYFDPVFTDVTVTTDVTYGVNATVIALQIAGQAIPQALKMDLYSPTGDNETARPLVIIMHSGNFLPPSVNGGCTGTIKDADNVEMATRLAKMGYVAAVADYRLGWNPIAGTQTERVYTLINAAYRGVQDSRTCARFFHKSAANGNPYGIDPNKIVLMGFGTGGYISFASATLDTITDTYIPKFLTPAGPMVIEPVNGNVDGTTVGITFPGYPGFPAGDTLNYPNHVGFSSSIAMAVNLGGALADTSFIDASDIPCLSFQTPTDPYAPCGTGIVNVPPPISLPVVEVSGSCDAQPIFDAVGVNSAMTNAGFDDPLSQHALTINGGIQSFYPFYVTDPLNSSPWAYASSAEPYGVAGSDCDVDAAGSAIYMDTIMTYFAPRACAVLGLYSDCKITTSVKGLSTIEVGQKATPNPTSENFMLQSDARFPMMSVQILDLSGRIIRDYPSVNANQFTVNRNGLSPGVYVARVAYKEGIVTQKVVLQ
ncbi:MAG: T9SS type A sorting domain-containing protein [Lewinellaceae bacterium]|nr:T9SS type A sorting domain-containing protein [Lewinellaceae bacterium]